MLKNESINKIMRLVECDMSDMIMCVAKRTADDSNVGDVVVTPFLAFAEYKRNEIRSCSS